MNEHGMSHEELEAAQNAIAVEADLDKYADTMRYYTAELKRLDTKLRLIGVLQFVLLYGIGMCSVVFVVGLVRLGVPEFEHYDTLVMLFMFLFGAVLIWYANHELGKEKEED